MIFWICALLALGSALSACLVLDMRRAILSLWLCSLGVGGLYLAMGAETLAVVQWIVSTLIAIAFIFYAVMFGEYSTRENESAPAESFSRRALQVAMPALLGVAFTATIWLGAAHLPNTQVVEFGPVPQMDGADIINNQNVAVLGQSLAENHLLSLEILGLTLFLVVVGGGVVARPERAEPSGTGESS